MSEEVVDDLIARMEFDLSNGNLNEEDLRRLAEVLVVKLDEQSGRSCS